MVKKLHVGNLAYSVTDDSLKTAFSQFGSVESATVIRDKISGRSKGFGFVEMSTEEEASQAIEKLNKSAFEGRTMFVSESRLASSNGGGSHRSFEGNRGYGRDSRDGRGSR
jgi:RNA recognition motif-containing protein